MLRFMKARAIEIGTGLISSAIFAILVLPDEQVNLGSLGLGLIAIPVFLILIIGSLGFYFIYALMRIIEMILTKLEVFHNIDST